MRSLLLLLLLAPLLADAVCPSPKFMERHVCHHCVSDKDAAQFALLPGKMELRWRWDLNQHRYDPITVILPRLSQVMTWHAGIPTIRSQDRMCIPNGYVTLTKCHRNQMRVECLWLLECLVKHHEGTGHMMLNEREDCRKLTRSPVPRPPNTPAEVLPGGAAGPSVIGVQIGQHRPRGGQAGGTGQHRPRGGQAPLRTPHQLGWQEPPLRSGSTVLPGSHRTRRRH